MPNAHIVDEIPPYAVERTEIWLDKAHSHAGYRFERQFDDRDIEVYTNTNGPWEWLEEFRAETPDLTREAHRYIDMRFSA